MRQRLGKKKTDRLKRETGLPIVEVLVRGGTDHRKDLHLEDGSCVMLFKNGDLAKQEPYRPQKTNFPDPMEYKF